MLWAKLGTELKFSSSHHPQTDGQTEVINRSLGSLLRSLIKKNMREWESCLPHAEFAFNRSVNRTTRKSPFEIVYGKNPLGPMELSPILNQHVVSSDAEKRVRELQELHDRVRELIEKQNGIYKRRADKHKKLMVFAEGDLVWIHLRKERFPNRKFPKLQPRADGPFRVIKKMGNNAYRIDLPEEYGVSPVFNVADLAPFVPVDDDSRASLFQPGENNAHEDEENKGNEESLLVFSKSI